MESEAMPPVKEIKLALNQLEELKRFLKNPGGPVEDIVAKGALRVAIAEIETVLDLASRREPAAV
jgi:hypothetical protein